jgi:hypothetical protein
VSSHSAQNFGTVLHALQLHCMLKFLFMSKIDASVRAAKTAKQAADGRTCETSFVVFKPLCAWDRDIEEVPVCLRGYKVSDTRTYRATQHGTRSTSSRTVSLTHFRDDSSKVILC